MLEKDDWGNWKIKIFILKYIGVGILVKISYGRRNYK